MFPAKNALLAAALVFLLTALVHHISTSALKQASADSATGQVSRAAELFLKQDRLSGLEFAYEVAGWARDESLPRALAIEDVTARRAAANQAANKLNEGEIQKAHDRRAALVALVDASGKVVARDLSINSLYGEDLKSRYPAVVQALSGVANKDVWAFNGRMYRVAVAPVRGADAKVVGALVVGFEESGNDARVLRDNFGTEVVIFLNGKIYASSFASQAQESVEEAELAQVLFSGAKLAGPAVQERKRTEIFRVTLRGEVFLGMAAPLLGNTSKPEAGFVVLASLNQGQQVAGRIGMWILGLGILGTLITVGSGVLTAQRFLVPLDKIEEGVTEIINGNHQYVFEKHGSPDFEGLENSLNVMVARLLGRPEQAEGGDAMNAMDLSGRNRVVSGPLPQASAPSGPIGSVASPPTSPSDLARAASGPKVSTENQDLSREPQDKYERRLYDEYVTAREQTGEGARDVTFASFTEKLRENEVQLCQKYGTRMVRFKVVIKQGQVTLKPVPIA